MAANNLRIIYSNIADTATVTASSTASSETTTANLKLDSKASVWRSATAPTTSVKAVLIVSFTSSMVSGVILPFCNLSSTATIRIRGYTGTAPTINNTVPAVPTVTENSVALFDTGNVACCPYAQLGLWDWGNLPLGVNAYSYGGGTYARVWLGNTYTCTSLAIEIIDTNANKYVEAARLIIGNHWSPTYNTEYGLFTSVKDLSTHERTQSGNLITNIGPRANAMTFDLNWLTPSDRMQFSNILRLNGLPKGIFVSLFPDNNTDWAKEQYHQLYGKLSQLGNITHPIYEMYSTQVEIEEI